MNAPLLPSRFLFRFAARCLYRSPLWTAKGAGLPDEYRLVALHELDEGRGFADVRGAWSEEGLVFSAEVRGKRQTPWCQELRLDESDGLRVWIDTRDTHNIHRASRFCHQFVFVPSGGGRDRLEPIGAAVLIHRARENPKAVRTKPAVSSRHMTGGYVIEAFIPAAALTGYDPSEHPRLGFQYAVLDRELGEQTFSIGGQFPYGEDPSVWGTLELVKTPK